MRVKNKAVNYSERQIERRFAMTVKERGGIALKFVSPSFAGMPDRLVLFPEGRIGFAEIKAPGKGTRAIQDSRIELLRSLGFRVFVIDSARKIQEAVDEILSV